MDVLLLWLGASAFACEPYSNVVGFDAWVDGAVDVPTDARIVTIADQPFDVSLTRPDTGEVTMTVADARALDTVASLWRVTHAPDAELAPSTEYRADVLDHYGVLYSATFTTGAGPTAGGFAAPTLANVSQTAWAELDATMCRPGSPSRERTVSGTLDVPDGLPVGSYVAVRTDAELSTFEYVADSADHDFDLVQGERSDESGLHDCLTPVLVLPSGEEITGDTTCIEGPQGPAKGGCATGGGVVSWGLAAVAVLGLAGRRRR